MAKQVKQFRYYGESLENQLNNFPLKININNLSDGTIFQDEKVLPISQLGIQTLPGTKFFLNGNSTQRPIIVGHTGIYELNLNNLTQITALQFHRESLELINNQNGVLIIDVIYEDGEK